MLIQDLEKRIQELESKIKEKESRQLNSPLDVISTEIVNRNVPVFDRTVTGAVSVGGYITCKINGLVFNILIK